MSRILFAASAIALTVAAPALANEREFTRDGVKFTFTTETSGDTRILAGTASGAPFRLVVKNGWVQGKFGGKQVSFAAPKDGRGRVDSAR